MTFGIAALLMTAMIMTSTMTASALDVGKDNHSPSQGVGYSIATAVILTE
jgi:hypothetical protein